MTISDVEDDFDYKFTEQYFTYELLKTMNVFEKTVTNLSKYVELKLLLS